MESLHLGKHVLKSMIDMWKAWLSTMLHNSLVDLMKDLIIILEDLAYTQSITFTLNVSKAQVIISYF